MRARLQHTLQAIALNHALREGRALWTAAGRRALQDLALPPNSAQRRGELLSPDFTRSAMSDLSNCAIAAINWNKSSPLGRLVSTDSVTDTKSIPNARHISNPDISCFKERANLSNFQTRTTSTDPRRQAFNSSFRAGRLELAPETPWSR
jgi:hypothetical protein